MGFGLNEFLILGWFDLEWFLILDWFDLEWFADRVVMMTVVGSERDREAVKEISEENNKKW